MGYDVDKTLKWMDDHHRSKGYSYSMTRRLGPKSFDCSSSVYLALQAGGWVSSIGYVGNTETLFKEKNLKEIFSYGEVKPGDIFIRGGEGSSWGAKGHTGIFYKKDGIVHSNYSNNGISYNDNDSHISYFLDRRRSANERYFRPIVAGETKPKAKYGKKSLETVADEVIAGKWGSGQVRFRALEEAGYSYRQVQDLVNAKLKSGKTKSDGVVLVKYENAKATFLADVKVRAGASTSSQVVASYKAGQSVYYDRVYAGNGYRWLSYVGASGKRRYVAYRRLSGDTRPWAVFS